MRNEFNLLIPPPWRALPVTAAAGGIATDIVKVVMAREAGRTFTI
jgi:hypothetical protein